MAPRPDVGQEAPRPSRVTRAGVDLAAAAANCRLARRLADGARVMAVIKADAYGHGAPPVARTLGPLVDAFGVARVEGAASLRRRGIEDRLVVLQGCLAAGELAAAVEHRLDVVVHREDQLQEAVGLPPGAGLAVWLNVDSGMHRLGFAPEQLRRAWDRLHMSAGISEVLLMSHLACADEVDSEHARRQVECFTRATAGLGGPRSLANSAALMGWPETRFDWVRPGLMLYGASPLARPTAETARLEPVMRFESEVIATRHLRPGEAVGYGARFVCERPMRIGTVAAGYGDGYPRAAPDGAPVVVGGHRTRLVGRVSMDSLTVDLTALPAGVGVGAAVELWGGEVRVEEVAAACGTNAYELLTRVAPRVPREYRLPS